MAVHLAVTCSNYQFEALSAALDSNFMSIFPICVIFRMIGTRDAFLRALL